MILGRPRRALPRAGRGPQVSSQVTIRALQAIHAATHPAAGNQPHHERDGGEAKRIAVSELLAALDEEAAEETGAAR